MSPGQEQGTITIEGVTFATLDGQPKARDLDIAVKLGYAQPRDVRKLIARWESKIGPVEQRATVARYEIRPGVWHEQEGAEYWLTERQAYIITAKSETPQALALLQQIIDVYVLAKAGLLPQQLAAGATAIKVLELEARVVALEGRQQPAPAPAPSPPRVSLPLPSRQPYTPYTPHELDAAVLAALPRSDGDLRRVLELLNTACKPDRPSIVHHRAFLAACARMSPGDLGEVEGWLAALNIPRRSWRAAVRAAVHVDLPPGVHCFFSAAPTTILSSIHVKKQCASAFLQECTRLPAVGELGTAAVILHRAYLAWASARNRPELTIEDFGRAMHAVQVPGYRSMQARYYPVVLLGFDTPPAEPRGPDDRH